MKQKHFAFEIGDTPPRCFFFFFFFFLTPSFAANLWLCIGRDPVGKNTQKCSHGWICLFYFQFQLFLYMVLVLLLIILGVFPDHIQTMKTRRLETAAD